jgi:SAM-dependent methyltransferase
MPSPRIYAAAGNSSRAYLHRFLTRAEQEVQAGQLVLDAGSGRAPYRGLFTHARYGTADFLAVKGKSYTEQDYVCDLADIPVEDARFDHVLLTQALEHVPEPRAVLAELHRVLKPGRDAVAHRAAVLRRAREALRPLPLHPVRATCSRAPGSRSARSSGWRATSARSATRRG